MVVVVVVGVDVYESTMMDGWSDKAMITGIGFRIRSGEVEWRCMT